MNRQEYIETLLLDSHGAWPDLEGLIRDIYVSYVQEGDVVLDVGVNHGTHLFQLAEAVGATGRIVGVEAVPAHVASVRAQLEGPYRHLADRIQLHACAVSRAPGKAEFFVSKINDGGLSGLQLRNVLAETEVERIEVDVKTIDELIDQEGKVSFVKIDIEGAEYDALVGSPRLMAQRPVIVFEFDDSAPANFHFEPSDFLALFRRNELAVYDVFGFPVEDAEAFLNARVWNFVAIPRELDAISITAPARRTLEARTPALADLSPEKSRG